MILVLAKKATYAEFQQAREVYPDYIKTVIDYTESVQKKLNTWL